MKVTASAVIKDGGVMYEPGVEYEVDEETGRRFVGHGWATSPDYTAASPQATTVDVTPASVRTSTTATEV